MIDFSAYQFHPVIHLPPSYEIYDFTTGYDPDRVRSSAYGVGRYNEVRPGMYTTPLFTEGVGEADVRNIHVGIDIAAPVGEPVYAFHDGEVHLFDFRSAPGDYGHTLILRHIIGGAELYALYGHLAAKSLEGQRIGKRYRAGDVIAWVGNPAENGGWNPHLHFQLSYDKPNICDLPGTVAKKDLAEALRKYPDPRLVLGPLY
ncbi:MAG: peptidoglycan DD-metalloendopeptidase family protein [Bdellovibrionaceae bacterium]|nr:peptidoglycan DD-metalloendopeptidase family protein [Pseudobdellovibrionaceae bacterium]